jgi:DNA-binding GntR family transcriptional regulator
VHHLRILDAIVRHDAAGAREAMRVHLQQVREDSQASAGPGS